LLYAEIFDRGENKMLHDALIGSVCALSILVCDSKDITTSERNTVLEHLREIRKVAERMACYAKYGEMFTVYSLLIKEYAEHYDGEVFSSFLEKQISSNVIRPDQSSKLEEIYDDINSDEASSDDGLFEGMFGAERLDEILEKLKSISHHQIVVSTGTEKTDQTKREKVKRVKPK
jgi:hypothetical protein